MELTFLVIVISSSVFNARFSSTFDDANDYLLER